MSKTVFKPHRAKLLTQSIREWVCLKVLRRCPDCGGKIIKDVSDCGLFKGLTWIVCEDCDRICM